MSECTGEYFCVVRIIKKIVELALLFNTDITASIVVSTVLKYLSVIY